MANAAIEIPFYVSKGGQPLTGAADEIDFETLKTLDGSDKSSFSPSISEIGGGWYKFNAAYGSVPFDSGDLVGVIDADKNGIIGLQYSERYIPVEVRLDFYGLARLVNKMSQNKLTGEMLIKNTSGDTILQLDMTETEGTVDREPGADE